MKYEFLVLGGAGMQGRIAARDLLEHGHGVYFADLYHDSLTKLLRHPRTHFSRVDLRDIPATVKLIKKVQPAVVVNCAEGDWDLNVYQACLQTKNHVIDLGSEIPMTQKQLAMHKDFKRADLIAITGCGSTPGVNDIMLYEAISQLDSMKTIELGFAWDSNIKKFVVPFSIQSIIEEFTDIAPYFKDGKLKKILPQESKEEREFRGIGRQECFLVRHPETYTFFVYNKKDGLKNVRFYAGFPKHSARTIQTFIDLGLGSKEPIPIEDKKIAPVEMLAQILKQLPVPEGYTEKENLWVKVFGKKKGARTEILMECIVETLPGWEDAGCNIDTGMPASIIAQMIRDGRITARGSFPPGPVVPCREFFKELRSRNMVVYQNGEAIN